MSHGAARGRAPDGMRALILVFLVILLIAVVGGVMLMRSKSQQSRKDL